VHPFFGQMTMNFRKACTLILDASKISKPIRATSQIAFVWSLIILIFVSGDFFEFNVFFANILFLKVFNDLKTNILIRL
jgi:hypothetical protein